MFALFKALDSAASFLPAPARLAIYGLILGALAMLIYWWISPQRKLAVVKQQMVEARQKMRAYDGTDPKEMLRLSGQSIAPALKQLLLVLFPTLVAALPVILAIVWLESSAYSGAAVWSIRPQWLASWHTPFFAGLTVAALGMKFGFKIH
jgi:hypothetical protein